MAVESEEPNGSKLINTKLRKRPAEKSADEVPGASMVSKETLSAVEEDLSKPRKTFGRTPDGRIFVVPQTHDMVSTLLSPTQPKNLSDIAILGVLALHIALLYFLPLSLRTPVLCATFLFWRAAYNFGIGVLLHNQSNRKWLVYWARKSGIFDPSRQPVICKLVKQEIEAKIPNEVKSGDYVFENAPIEYNTWLVFRRVVDLILMCDFVSYVLFAMSCASLPQGEGWVLTVGRWVGGIVLFMFNLWVKLDAHRVVKDYAWYWGDFFFLIDQNLTFDGVFEMAPHPMYSVGYAGYYGISLMAASYTVLFTSLLAHAAQFAFLTIVENPHIDKTYNPPAPRRRSAPPPMVRSVSSAGKNRSSSSSSTATSSAIMEDTMQTAKDHKLLGKFDLFHNTHLFTTLLVGYLVVLTLFTPNTLAVQTVFVIHALVWRLWHTAGIGAILHAQSNNKSWFRHFLKFGETREEAWSQWKSLYHVSLVMCHASFMAAGWKMYHWPAGEEKLVLFRHTVGIMLIALQLWTSTSIYESLGEFGWFYGDFFYELPSPGLTYSGIYRYLNNPERLIGCAGIWGIVLIASSSAIFMLGLLSHVCALLFIQFIERPHMQKLYGNKIRREAGVVRTIKNAIPPPVANHIKSFQGSVDKVLSETTEFVEEFLESARPKLAQGVMGVVKDTQFLFSQYPARLSITLLADDLANYDSKKYSLNIVNALPQEDSDSHRSLSVSYGEPIRVGWTAPVNHSRKDWIGLYRITDNRSRLITKIASMGRWIATCKDEYDLSEDAESGIISSDIPGSCADDGEPIVKGEVEFSCDKTFWSNGTYEFRYHHDGKHNVMAISLPFEIVIDKVEINEDEDIAYVDSEEMQDKIEKHLLPVVIKCFERKEELAPSNVNEEFGGLGEEKYAKRIVYAVKEMFGVDFAPEVVQADGNVRKLAWRICNAKKVLAPFSMNTAGISTPSTPRL